MLIRLLGHIFHNACSSSSGFFTQTTKKIFNTGTTCENSSKEERPSSFIHCSLKIHCRKYCWCFAFGSFHAHVVIAGSGLYSRGGPNFTDIPSFANVIRRVVTWPRNRSFHYRVHCMFTIPHPINIFRHKNSSNRYLNF